MTFIADVIDLSFHQTSCYQQTFPFAFSTFSDVHVGFTVQAQFLQCLHTLLWTDYYTFQGETITVIVHLLLKQR